ncbi:MAG: glycosyltransferase family 1 protein [Rhodospirillales bacterium]|nr:glycosyltransferase family 1 protein [Rhodospirillales bacterium]
MSKAVFNPVMYRPLFECLEMVTCRTFETPAAATIPLFLLDPQYVREIYGTRAMELVLGDESPHEKILDVLGRPEHYAEIVREIRQDFSHRHSPEQRLQALLQIIEE